MDILLFECVGVIASLLVFGRPGVLVIILYHFISWYFYPSIPIVKKMKIGAFQAIVAAGLYIAIFKLNEDKSLQTFAFDVFRGFGYFHITHSFFLSEQNPASLLWLKGKILTQAKSN